MVSAPGSCPGSPPWWTVTYKCKANKSFLHRSCSLSVFYSSNKKNAGTPSPFQVRKITPSCFFIKPRFPGIMCPTHVKFVYYVSMLKAYVCAQWSKTPVKKWQVMAFLGWGEDTAYWTFLHVMPNSSSTDCLWTIAYFASLCVYGIQAQLTWWLLGDTNNTCLLFVYMEGWILWPGKISPKRQHLVWDQKHRKEAGQGDDGM